MAYEVIVAPSAERALIVPCAADSSETFHSPSAARRLLDSFEVAIAALEQNPFAYPVDRYVSALTGAEVRKKRVGNYRIYYRVNQPALQVDVAHFFHVRQDAALHIWGCELMTAHPVLLFRNALV